MCINSKQRKYSPFPNNAVKLIKSGGLVQDSKGACLGNFSAGWSLWRRKASKWMSPLIACAAETSELDKSVQSVQC